MKKFKTKLFISFLLGAISLWTVSNLISNYVLPSYSTDAVTSNGSELDDLLNSDSAQKYVLPIEYQERFSFCGAASITNVLRSYGLEAPSQKHLLESDASPGYWKVMFNGMTMEELASLLASSNQFDVLIERPITLEEIHEVLALANKPDVRVIINYSRMPLFGENIGHHTPVAAYDIDRKVALLLDVTEGYGNYSVTANALLVAIRTSDSETGSQRGFVIIRENKK